MTNSLVQTLNAIGHILRPLHKFTENHYNDHKKLILDCIVEAVTWWKVMLYKWQCNFHKHLHEYDVSTIKAFKYWLHNTTYSYLSEI